MGAEIRARLKGCLEEGSQAFKDLDLSQHPVLVDTYLSAYSGCGCLLGKAHMCARAYVHK